jgi:putative copper export protein/methionine-rich copper-binding protein CopC
MHAMLISSDPKADATLTVAPTRVHLVFSEEIETALGTITLIASDGREIKLAATSDARNVNALVAPVGSLTNGAYRVAWRIVSSDGHPIDGSYVFTLAVPGGQDAHAEDSAAPTTTAAAPPPAAAAPAQESAGSWGPAIAGAPLVPSLFRGLGLGSLTALAGLLGFLSFSRTTVRHPRAVRAITWLSVASALFLVLHLVVWMINVSPTHRLSGDFVSSVLQSGAGRMDVARTTLALLACWAFVLARQRRLALALAVGALLVSAGTGHSAAILPIWTIPARGLHLVALAAWLGGLLWLLVCDRSETGTLAREAGRVSTIALIGVIVVTFTGVVQTVSFLPSLGDLFRTPYGYAALAKVAGLGVLVLFGAHHRFRVIPRLPDPAVESGFSTTLRRELGVMSLVMLLGGLLAYIPTPTH